jgi:UDP-glucose 4-epimerase
VGDCAEANALALDGPAGTYNLGWGGEVTVNQVFAGLAALTGYLLPPVYGPAKPGETYRISLDATRARQVLGWQPRTPWPDGLAPTVRWFAERRVARLGERTGR